MSRTGCISHPAHEPLIVIHRWQLEFCKDDKGKMNECAAGLLSFFEYWHNIKLEMSERNRAANDAFEREGKGRPYQESLLQWHSTPEIEAALLIFKRSSIQAAIDLLVKKKAVEVLRNPVLKYDNTRHFLFHPEVLNEWLKDHQPNSAFRPTENSKSQEDGRSKAPFPQHLLKTADESAESGLPSTENSQPFAENSGTIPETSTEITPENTTTTPRARTHTQADVLVAEAPSSSFSSVDGVSEEPAGKLSSEDRLELDAITNDFRSDGCQKAKAVACAKRRGMEFVREQADIVRTKQNLRNLAGAFEKACDSLEGWKRPKAAAKKPARAKALEPKPEEAPPEPSADFSAELAWWQSASEAQEQGILSDPRLDLYRKSMRKRVTAASLGLNVLRQVLADQAQERAGSSATAFVTAQRSAQEAA